MEENKSGCFFLSTVYNNDEDRKALQVMDCDLDFMASH